MFGGVGKRDGLQRGIIRCRFAHGPVAAKNHSLISEGVPDNIQVGSVVIEIGGGRSSVAGSTFDERRDFAEDIRLCGGRGDSCLPIAWGSGLGDRHVPDVIEDEGELREAARGEGDGLGSVGATVNVQGKFSFGELFESLGLIVVEGLAQLVDGNAQAAKERVGGKSPQSFGKLSGQRIEVPDDSEDEWILASEFE